MAKESHAASATLPYLTADLPGVGGRIKQHPEDFVVEEVPLYEASGEGTHLYLRIEKQNLTTREAVRRIARTAGKQARDVGYAGLKDAAAITRQTLSIEHVDPAVFSDVDLGRMKILAIDRHGNKLKLGHLRGNRFVLKIREVSEDDVGTVREIVGRLTDRGVPNYFGPQRFGARGDNGLVGRAVICGDFEGAVAVILGRPGDADSGPILRARKLFDEGKVEEAWGVWPSSCQEQRRLCNAVIRARGDCRKAWRAVDRTLRKLYLSAYQSYLFNAVLAQRIGKIDAVERGDMAYKHVNGACFRVEDVAEEQPRCDAFEISPTGPIFGKRMTELTDEPGALEAAVLAGDGVDLSQFTPVSGIKLDGARRPLRVPLGESMVADGSDENGDFIELTFSLPPGSYATAVTREVCKD